MSILKKMELFYRRMRNMPKIYIIVGKDENGNYRIPEGYNSVREVGEPITVRYPAYHDMQLHFVMAAMTDVELGKGRDVNAVYIGEVRNINDIYKEVEIQPLKVE